MNLARLTADGILAEYGRTTPGEANSVTKGNAIGVAFSPQNHAVWTVGGTRLSGAIAPSSVFVSPKEGFAWNSWDLIGETIEMWLDGDRLSRLSHEHGGPSRIDFDLHDRRNDPVIVDIAARVRQVLCAPFPSRERLSALGDELGAHYLAAYEGLANVNPPALRPLDAVRLRRVLDYLEAHLGDTTSIDRLAAVAALSPFHFARAFKAATGASPHGYLLRRRMDRAATLFRSTNLPVADVAQRVGFASLPHFRSQFRRHWSAGPGEFSRLTRL